jgi:hypothetical protein
MEFLLLPRDGQVALVDLPDAAAARAYAEPGTRILRWRDELGGAGAGGFLVLAHGVPEREFGPEFVARHRDRLAGHGPLLPDDDRDGRYRLGTAMLVDAPDRAAVEAMLAARRPERVEIHPVPPGARPARNRVTPLGDVVGVPLRGAWTGNRGVLHTGRRITRFHASDLWITCALSFRGRWRQQWLPHRFTWLYFHDEAVSFAAGHRPCGECRRASYRDYRDRWADELAVPTPSAKDMNRRLHAERIVRGTHRRRVHELAWAGLPDGTFVVHDGLPAVVLADHLTQWTPRGYGARVRRPARGSAQVITPPATVAVLRSGYPVQLDGTTTETR